VPRWPRAQCCHDTPKQGVTGAIYVGISEKAKPQIATKLTDAGFGS
jgi:hypothetical protein